MTGVMPPSNERRKRPVRGRASVMGARVKAWHKRAVDDARFDEIARDHREVLEAVDILDAALQKRRPDDDASPRLTLADLEAFLVFCDRTLEPHLKDEERELYPLLDRYLPPDVGSADVMFREHETMRGLVSLLRHSRESMGQGVSATEPEAASHAQDLSLLLREHIRKEEGVINPLLRRLLSQRSHV